MIIDTHLHFYDGGFPPGAYEPVAVNQMIDTLKRHDIRGAWISSLSSMVKDPIHGNKVLYEFCKENLDVLKPFYSFNPNLPLEGMKQEIRKCVENYHAYGFKIHSWLSGCSVSTGSMYELAGLCAECGMPILFHDGTPPYCDPLQIASLGKLYPNLKIILGHAGISDMHHDAIRAFNENENVYMCFCCTPVGDVEDIVNKVDTDRLFFGTDFYGIACFSSYVENMIDCVRMANIPEEIKEKIFYKNPLRFMQMI